MKKFTAILLLSLYSLSSLGLSLKSFYCCGKLKSVTVTITQDQQKECSNSDGKSDCCKTKFQIFKVKDNHVAGDVINAPLLNFLYLHLFPSSYRIMECPYHEHLLTHQSNAPPVPYSVPGYIFNCVFRI